MIALLLATAAAAAVPGQPAIKAPSHLAEADKAIRAGRLEQGRLMIARAVQDGAKGLAIDRLIAELAFHSGRFVDALHQYQGLAASGDRSGRTCEHGAISALSVGRVGDARPFLDCALAAPAPTWRAFNACGVAADFAQDWAAADRCYKRARRSAGERPEILNNQGWSWLLRGDWAAAAALFERAVALAPKSGRYVNNLELARSALDAELPARRPGESEDEWAERLNDAGVAAELLGDRKRAVAALTQALYARGRWYERAAANLDWVSTQ